MSAPPGAIAKLRADVLAKLDEIERELTSGYLDKQMWPAMRDEITARRADVDGTWPNHYTNLYGAGQVMRIRRLADDSAGKVDSLWWLIERVRTNPAIASRQTLLDDVTAAVPDWNKHIVAEAGRRFDDVYGPGELPSDDALVVLQARLRSEVAAVLEHADRHVAHRDPRGSRARHLRRAARGARPRRRRVQRDQHAAAVPVGLRRADHHHWRLAGGVPPGTVPDRRRRLRLA